ncbi:ribosomal protein S18-alanine N-acetyltransferase [Dickeya dadantii]|uniref:ribosomal protein S18-alanine N-acetyltransferase n=1 Tax=Dickeya dadantii TaxID=204038 RepID=UPI0009809CB5|nr:ribosomal protein S18-alanine N-acetyltransferase [Dickeya dadantii]NPE52216.1 ribosomal-protein-alanine N-acetyltransferase [Dickeya dadantii]NPE53758.1 ribosomal protein S18-alanine N-acetyltransferase [Dickeya dadantii]NPE67860.1 ribosomal protein S18-alanine N-acetyltransferase [Dickeya dadantii]OOC13245.1 ribosomal-protein-alanine N-acetyltransferase [Dickeya dadantii]UAY96938.1 ribosomal protein S18-alanine N-acetyltransferase [Dickeya dadantii]
MNMISTLTTADLPRAFEIECLSHAFPWSEKTLISNQGERYLNLKLCHDQQLVAYAITQVVLDEATLFNIAVAPTHQRHGYGRQLLEHLIAELEHRGMLTLWLEVRASNARAIALYQSMGFNEVSVRRDYYPTAGGREDAIIMALPLG